MNTFINKVRLIVSDRGLRNRILFTLGALVLFRVLAIIPIPGIDPFRLQSLFSNNQFLGLLNLFSGGGLSRLSIVMLGVGPYITGSIIMQLLTIMSPRLKAMYQEEGEAGRKRFSYYSRLLTLPLAVIQGFSFLTLLTRSQVLPPLGLFSTFQNIVIISAGSVLLMWLGELITEFGIGNGVSLLIFSGIVAALPSTLNQFRFTFDVSQIPVYLAFLIGA
ncbi:preprotein translocase subunit SecY, partial [Candidatus Parcubacteria bacterium]|nr:preprotein translocase subunit SecY [Candidatus Parcubacteria bacterium]